MQGTVYGAQGLLQPPDERVPDAGAAVINEMDEALAKEEFVVYFQPKYELTKMQPYGAEALSAGRSRMERWFRREILFRFLKKTVLL